MRHSELGTPGSRLERWLAAVACLLAAGQALLVFASWLIGALAPELGLRSLLDGEGIRWFFAHFCSIVGGWGLVWLLLAAASVGCVAASGLAEACRHPRRLSLRGRSALSVALFFVVIYVAIMAVLVAPRRAILAGIDGSLWPSPFSLSLLPAVAFGLCFASVVYGVVAGRLDTVRKVFRSLHVGMAKAAPWLLLYVLLMQFLTSLSFVLGGLLLKLY